MKSIMRYHYARSPYIVSIVPPCSITVYDFNMERIIR